MSIDKSEAAAALAAAGQTQKRSSALYVYRFNAPMLMLWGAIWLIADLTIALSKSDLAGRWAWPILATLGGVLSALYYWRYGRDWTSGPTSKSYFWRMMGTWMLNIGFVICVSYIFAPYTWREPHAFFGILMAALYCIFGVWMGWRLTALGVALFAAVLYGYFALTGSDFLLFVGLVCGGGMILGGFWLRSVS